MIRYIPPFFLNRFENDRYSGSFESFVLFFDIADFTVISNEFRKHGKRGAEELSRFLEEIFTYPLNLVEKNGGFVSVFAGDGFCTLFPEGKPERIVNVVKKIEQYFAKHRIFSSACGDFKIAVRLTISSGMINWQIFQNEYQNEYVFYGEPLQEISQLSVAKQAVAWSKGVLEQIDRINAVETETIYPDLCLDYPFSHASYEKFCHKRLLNEQPANEIRDAAFCFVDLSQIAVEEWEQTLAVLHDKLDAYSGFLTRLDGTGKGLEGFILFGLPKSEGNTLDRICRFALDVANTIPKLLMSIASGNVYAGFVGVKHTREYTAVGAAVNLVARLLSKSADGRVITDTWLQRDLHHRYIFSNIGFIELKGFSAPVNVYRLEGFRSEKLNLSESEFTGRDVEISVLQSFLKAKDSSVVYVSGEAGVGKSRLISEAIKGLPDSCFHKFFTFCDPVSKKSLEPVKQILHSYFGTEHLQSIKRNLEKFHRTWSELAQEDQELLRIESFIASLLGYEWEHSIFSFLPPEKRSEQIKHAFVSFLQALAEQKPIIIHLDDPQWIETKTLEYFRALGENSVPFVHIICACRYNEDGSQVDLGLPGFRKEVMDLNHLTPVGSKNLISQLLNHSNIPRTTLELIITRSEGNPFFIEQLTAYLKENNQFDQFYNITVDTTLISTFGIADIIGNRIDNLTERVRQTLQNACVLGLEFNTELLANMLGMEIEEDLSFGKSRRVWTNFDEISYIFSHVLIKDIAYQRMLTQRLQQLHLLAAQAMERLFAKELDSNAEDIANHYLCAGEEIKAAQYYSKAGDYFAEKYDFTKAETNLNRALEIHKRILGEEHPDTASSINLLACMFYVLGQNDRAELLFQTAFNIREKVLGSDHPDTALSLNNLATLYMSQGKYDQSELLFLKSLDIFKKVYGSEHQETARTAINLAYLYVCQTKYDQAEVLYLSTLETQKKLFGLRHVNSALTINYLGLLYVNQGRYDLGESMFLQALEILEEKLGSEHPNTGGVINNLAILYTNQGKLDLAESMYLKTLKISERVFGAEHPETATMLNNLSHLYTEQGKFELSEIYYLRCLKIREETLGVDHHETAATLNNLANLYDIQGKYDEVEISYLRALNIQKTVLGEEHPSTALSLNNLAVFYHNQSKFDQAEHLYLKVLEIRERILGMEHPDTAKTLNYLGDLYRKQGVYEKAEPLYQRALMIQEKTLGEEHPDTVSLLNSLADLFKIQSKFAQAEIFNLKALAISEKILGPEHLKTASSLSNLAGIYKSQGKYTEAEPLYIRALAICEKYFGPDHLYTTTVGKHLCDLYEKAGQPEKALACKVRLEE